MSLVSDVSARRGEKRSVAVWEAVFNKPTGSQLSLSAGTLKTMTVAAAGLP